MNILYTDISQLPANGYQLLLKGATIERKNKAKRYVNRDDAIRCLAAGALLQYIAGPGCFDEDYTPQGKPFIEGREDLHFNLSHSGKYVVIAFGDSEVGVDVEKIPEDPDKLKIARRYFTRDEQDYVFSSEEDALLHFTEIWTKKESFLKYLGTGLGTDLTSFSVLSPDFISNFHTWILEDGYCLSLCTTESKVRIDRLNIKWFLPRP